MFGVAAFTLSLATEIPPRVECEIKKENEMRTRRGKQRYLLLPFSSSRVENQPVTDRDRDAFVIIGARN